MSRRPNNNGNRTVANRNWNADSQSNGWQNEYYYQPVANNNWGAFNNAPFYPQQFLVRGNNKTRRANGKRGRGGNRGKRGGRGANNNNNYNNNNRNKSICEPPNDDEGDVHLNYNIANNINSCILPQLNNYGQEHYSAITARCSDALKVTTDYVKTDCVTFNVSNIIYKTKVIKNKKRNKTITIGSIFSAHEKIEEKFQYALADISDYEFGKNPKLHATEIVGGVKKKKTTSIDSNRAFTVMQAVNGFTCIVVDVKRKLINEVIIAETTMPYIIINDEAPRGNTVSDSGRKPNALYVPDPTNVKTVPMEENIPYYVSDLFLTNIGTVTILPNKNQKKVRFFDKRNRTVFTWGPTIPMPTPGTNGNFYLGAAGLQFVIKDNAWCEELLQLIREISSEGQFAIDSTATSMTAPEDCQPFISGNIYRMDPDEN